MKQTDERTSEASTASVEIATMASCIAHDFGNLVTLISGHADLLARSPTLDLASRSDALAIRGAARRAKHLVTRWLDFYKPRPLNAEAIRLSPFLQSVVTLAQPALCSRIALSFDVAPPELAVYADREHLERCLLNLILNARDALNGEGDIWISAQPCSYSDREDGGVLLSVRDNGPGMTHDQRTRLFEPFFTTKRHGTGLGLLVVRDFIENSSGSLHVESESARGTVFQLRLQRAIPLYSSSPASETPPQAQGETVLLVQPDQALAAPHRELLEAAGYRVLLAAGAGEALLVSQRFEGTIDVALVDSNLQWMSHRELHEQLKAARSQLLIVLLAATPLANDPSADRLLVKPFDGKTLLLELDALLRERFSVVQHSQTRIRITPTSEHSHFRAAGIDD